VKRKLKDAARHLLILIVPVAVTWVGEELLPIVQDSVPRSGVLGVAIGMLVLVATPLTKRYGVGSGRNPAPVE
jgi:hypothetical protein